MTKRVTVLLAAVLIPIMLLVTGCGKNNELSMQEYYDRLRGDFKQYIDDLKEVGDLQTSVDSVDDLKAQQQKAKELCEKAEKTLDDVIKMTPPSHFAEKHKTLVSAAELEKRFLQATEKVFTATTSDELEKYLNETEAVFKNVPMERQFAGVITDLLLEVKEKL